MSERKVIPVKYFYYGMMTIALIIGGVFFFLWYKESKEEQLLAENGCTAKAKVIELYERKTSKRSNPNYYMEVGFFITHSEEKNTNNKKSTTNHKTNDALVASIAESTEALSQSLGDYVVQTIPLNNYNQYNQHPIGSIVEVIYLKENPSIIRLK